MSNPNLAGKVALVTGGSKGIGAASVLALAAAGASVVINYSSDGAPAEALVRQIGDDRALAIKADAGSVAAIEAMVAAAVERFGKLDIVVACAAIAPNKDVEGTTEADFDAAFALNVKGPYFLVQKVVPHLAPDARIILFSTSLCAASTITANYLLYCSTKGAIEQMVRVMSKDLGRRGIRVNAVAPGPTGTELFYRGKPDELVARIAGFSPMVRVAEPDEIAGAVLFLSSAAGAWVSGQTLRVNGAMC